MKCSAFIATSVDGYIARLNNDLSWLEPTTPDNNNIDMGFKQFMSSIDCIIMGHNTFNVIMDMNPPEWPYGSTAMFILSHAPFDSPRNLPIKRFSGDIKTLVHDLAQKGFKHAYIDGGRTIQSFLHAQLLQSITITSAPVLIGDGIKLFSSLPKDIKLINAKAQAFANNFVQVYYDIKY